MQRRAKAKPFDMSPGERVLPNHTPCRISVVSPVYRAQAILPELCQQLDAALSDLTDDYEIILVDDRSPDDSWSVMKEMAQRYPRLTVVRLSRNFGQHFALTAGLNFARGEWVVTMDCDLQDRPAEIRNLLAKAEEGHDIVLGRRLGRRHSLLQRATSRLFYWLFSHLTGTQLDSSVGTFRILHRRVVDAYCEMGEAYRFFGGMIEWLGFETAYVDVEHAERTDGRSSYTFLRRFKLTVDAILAFSERPLHISIAIGALISILAAAYGTSLILRQIFMDGFGVPGWLSTITLNAFIGGLILFNLGILGLYVGRIYGQSKQRPLYVIDRVLYSTDTAPPSEEGTQA
jgi:dolichol-phosphate mannosyltransferase